MTLVASKVDRNQLPQTRCAIDLLPVRTIGRETWWNHQRGDRLTRAKSIEDQQRLADEELGHVITGEPPFFAPWHCCETRSRIECAEDERKTASWI